MLWFVILGVLAAFGALCLFWAMFGWLLPGRRGTVTLFFCGKGRDETGAILRHRCLKKLGLIHGILIVVGSTLPGPAIASDVILCSQEELSSRLSEEWSRLG